tara:strand:- start:1054 stop:1314 length:261 start_codon:yes stop_codon:yes gene_type:complete
MFVFGCSFFCTAVIFAFPYIGKIVNLYGDLKMTKAMKATLVALVLSGASYGVYAACGDNNGKWTCAVETPSGIKICDEDNRCTISC